MLRVREDGLQELGVVGAVHVDGDRRLGLEVLAPAGDAAAGLAVAGIVPSRYTSLISLRFIVQWIYAGLVAHLYLLYEDTRMWYPLLSFSCTLLVTVLRGPSEAARSCRDADAANSSTLVTGW